MSYAVFSFLQLQVCKALPLDPRVSVLTCKRLVALVATSISVINSSDVNNQTFDCIVIRVGELPRPGS